MNATRNPDFAASERMLGKVLDMGRPMRRRARLVQRGLVAGFVAVEAAAGVAGVSLATGRPSVSPAGTGGPARSSVPGGGANIQYSMLHPDSVAASSRVARHPASAATDNDTLTYWATAASKGSPTQGQLPGIGEWLELNYAQSEAVSAFSIIPGDQSTPTAFGKTARPQLVELRFSSGPPVFATVPDAPKFWDVKFAVHDTTFIQLQVLSVYPGTAKSGPLDVLAITEVAAYTSVGPTTTTAP